MSLKIGILIEESKSLRNWQLRIIETILNDPTLELNVLIQVNDSQKFTSSGQSKFFFSQGILAKMLFALQRFIERRVFFKEVFCVDAKYLAESLNEIHKIKIKREDKSINNTIAPRTAQQLKQRGLDLIVDLVGSQISLQLSKTSKHGVWHFLHADFSLPNFGITGFSEVLQKKPTIGFALLKRTSATQALVVDKAFFNREWYMSETAAIAQEGSVSVLFKNIRKLQNGDAFDVTQHNLPQYKYPTLYEVICYSILFYRKLAKKFFHKVAFKLWGQRHECWSVFIGKGRFMKVSLLGTTPLAMPKDEFWADPFLFKHKGIDYLFFENYSYQTKRGKISCGIVEDQKLVQVVDVLDFDYHLSFPFIFEEDGDIFLMPETSENKRLEIYKAIEFPTKWQLFTTAFEGEMVADAFFFNDATNQKWLFVNKQAAVTSPMNSELFIYRTDSIKLDNLIPHRQNPVIIDARVARNGGAIFTTAQGIYRPSQRNTDGIYGRALNINRIKKLTLDEYEEETVKVVMPNFDKNLMAMHHLHQTDELFVFDAAYELK